MNSSAICEVGSDMDYVKPTHSIQEINAAGKVVANFNVIGGSSQEAFERYVKFNDAISTIDQWRRAHHFPMNSIYTTLRNRSLRVSSEALYAQRLKRLVSVASKLWDRDDMKLSQMQDIGGCRAILPTMHKLNELRALYEQKPVAHEFIKGRDYIAEPKSTGYRSIHLIYRFSGKGSSEPWHDMKVEIQLRTLLQHKWATAVESAETITGMPLKANKGKPEWLRFFALMSSLFALREATPTVPNTPTDISELVAEVKELNKKFHIYSTLVHYHALIPKIEKTEDAYHYLIVLDPVLRAVVVKGFKEKERDKADQERFELEKQLEPGTQTQVVVVSVDSIAELKRAYPNYFMDIYDFLQEVNDVIQK